MLNDILFAFWFFLPAGFANVSPIVVSKIPLLSHWNTPIDFGVTYKGKQLFGSNKTWRGLFFGVLVSECIFLLEQRFAQDFGSFSNYLVSMQFNQLPFIFGLLLGFGVIAGDAVESFFKRQRGIPPGNSWFPFDQTDYIIGGCLAVSVITVMPLVIYIWIFVAWFLMHLLFSYLGFLSHFKAKPI
jgi:CDP-2,3-bis-(O-geranylgeranyl)-sn-glycerol synthase